MIGFPPGGAVDIVARIMGHWLSEHFGQHSWWKTAPAPLSESYIRCDQERDSDQRCPFQSILHETVH
jgi:hypothetical protein